MNVFLLGAGRPARGVKPSALKNISHNLSVLDWQIRAFSQLEHTPLFHYLGGYHADEIIRKYPGLRYTIIPDWEQGSVLDTLLSAPISASPTVIKYSDTVFRPQLITALCSSTSDICFVVDGKWEHRYASRSERDMEIAEKIDLADFNAEEPAIAEFTGLVYFQASVTEYLSSLEARDIGTGLVDLLYHLKGRGYSIEPLDVDGQWAELNEPGDIAGFILGTKADTLARLEKVVSKSTIGKQVSFTVNDWHKNTNDEIVKIRQVLGETRLVVRSSAMSEDGWKNSHAGQFESHLKIDGSNNSDVKAAVDSVIASYNVHDTASDQILVQEFVENTRMSGVVFTRGLENGSPYYRFNFDDKTDSTDSVTGGTTNDLRTILVHRQHAEELNRLEPALSPVLEAVQELENILGFAKLDIEFAVSESNEVYIFQVRPITVDHSEYETDDGSVHTALNEGANRFLDQQGQKSTVFGNDVIFGNMPDWNPAEIVGTKPRPLSLSLYQYLITNEIWAQQRAEFGYRDVRPHPLLTTFCGHPYVDVRASLNSFIPVDIDGDLAQKLAETYLDILSENTHLHDKIEFGVAFTAWTPVFLKEAGKRLSPYGLSTAEIDCLESSLKQITLNAISRLDGDVASIDVMNQRRIETDFSDLSVHDKIYEHIENCRRFGTLAFAHAARSAFVATDLLRGLVSEDILTTERYQSFMHGIDTITATFSRDRADYSAGGLGMNEMVSRYGHLRPGTYEVTKQAYWEMPDAFLAGPSVVAVNQQEPFQFTTDEASGVKDMLIRLGSDITPQEFGAFLSKAICSRELTKFEFTKNVSRALDLFVEFANGSSLSRDECSFIDYNDFLQYHAGALGISNLKNRISERRSNHTTAQIVELPALILSEKDFYCFERQSWQPNFVTTKRVVSDICVIEEDGYGEKLKGRIAIIPQADPGYDWLMNCGLSGLITKYGGANSHMAIRAAEAGLPAAIGVGEKLYENLTTATRIELDCSSQTIRAV